MGAESVGRESRVVCWGGGALVVGGVRLSRVGGCARRSVGALVEGGCTRWSGGAFIGAGVCACRRDMGVIWVVNDARLPPPPPPRWVLLLVQGQNWGRCLPRRLLRHLVCR